MVTMRKILAIDAGGTSTRAVILDSTGRCLAFGRAGSGNPTAVGVDGAVAQLAAAAERAVAGDASPADRGSPALIALAGAPSSVFAKRLSARFAPLGFGGELILEPDLLGTYYSGAFERHGYALIAGTGAVAGRVADGRLDGVHGGTGWLLGDAGSGFWIGRRIARAVVAALDGLGPETALTALMLGSLGVEEQPGGLRGRPQALIHLMDALYALRPVDLARLAPLAFEALDDPVSSGILHAAAEELARLLAATRVDGVDGPVVLGGGLLAAGMRVAPSIFADRLADAADGAELIAVPDGVVGAAVLALRREGVDVDGRLFSRIRDDVARVRAATEDGEGGVAG